jgi:ubiquinone/menaquinone biosynthesis C-methylase UbiE
MPDVYAAITKADERTVQMLGDALELRATDSQQQQMLADYLSRISFPSSAQVLEIGCGTGAISRRLAAVEGVAHVVGTDPSPGLLARARTLSEPTPRLSFQEADGRDLPFEDGRFDVVVVHTVVSHVPNPERLVSEAWRVLRPGGAAAFFDGDYSTITVAAAAHDPLQSCAMACVAGFVNDPWVVRRLPSMLTLAGFVDLQFRSHGYAQITEPAYMLSLVDRGADVLRADGLIGDELASALKAEGRRRDAESSFFGHIAYASIVARKA